MDVVAVCLASAAGLVAGSVANRLIVREPGYVITDPGDLPEGADDALLDELEPEPTDLPPVPVLAVVRPRSWWRWWFPVTELTIAAAWGVTVARLDWSSVTAAVLFVEAALLTLAAVDFRVYRIPDRINFPSMAIGLAAIVAASIEQGAPRTIPAALFGGFSYATLLFLAHLVSPRGMGWGDVKLAWLMGFFLGWLGFREGDLVQQLTGSLQGVLEGAVAGSVLGVVIGGGYALVRRSARAVFPYGPALAVGCIIALLTR